MKNSIKNLHNRGTRPRTVPGRWRWACLDSCPACRSVVWDGPYRRTVEQSASRSHPIDSASIQQQASVADRDEPLWSRWTICFSNSLSTSLSPSSSFCLIHSPAEVSPSQQVLAPFSRHRNWSRIRYPLNKSGPAVLLFTSEAASSRREFAVCMHTANA